MSGLYGVQSVSGSKDVPDVTVYRADPAAAENWLGRMISLGQHKHHLMNYAPDKWDVYDRRGELVGPAYKVCKAKITCTKSYPTINHERLVADAMMTLKLPGRLTPIVSVADSHKEPIAARANALLVMRRLILDASEQDLNHFYLVDSRRHRCRLTTIFADIQKLSNKIQDIYLDQSKFIQNGECIPDKSLDLVVTSMMVDYALEHQFAGGMQLWCHVLHCMVETTPEELQNAEKIVRTFAARKEISKGFWNSMAEVFFLLQPAVKRSEPLFLGKCLDTDVYDDMIANNEKTKLEDLPNTLLLLRDTTELLAGYGSTL